MRKLFRRALVTVLAALLMTPAIARSQTPPPAGDALHDCSRWPASVYDERAASCVCSQGLWWNLRGDACLPKEHAAGEFCSTVWPGSSPMFTAGGGHRCVCAPPLIWNAEATACRPAITSGEEECSREWPGTLPVIAPSGTEFECRCPGGRRWDDGSRHCVDGAPEIRASRGFFAEDYSAPLPAPPPAADEAAPLPEPGYIPQQPSGDVAPVGGGGASTAPVGGSAAGTAPAAAGSPACESLLAAIRARAQAGQSDQADALGMKAAISGCDPRAISEAARVPARGR